MAKDADGNFIPQYISQNAYANPDQKSGYWDDNSKVTIWNPKTGQYNTVEVDPQNVSEFAPQNETTGYYINEQGDYVLGYEDGAALGFNGEVYEQNYDYGGPFIPTKKLTPIPPGGGNNGGGTNPSTPVNPTVPTPGTPFDPPFDPADPYNPDDGTGNPNNPTNDWFWTDPVGYENAPQPDGDGTFTDEQPPADTSWDWDAFRDKAPGDRQWGGYDIDYQAFERYQPGDRSPWGMPNIEGGNRDFYQQQFVNQLRDEQGFQNRERQAQELRNFAMENPYEAAPTDWSFANKGKGIRDVQMGTGQSVPSGYMLNRGLNSGATNDEIFRWASANEGFDSDDRDWYKQMVGGGDDGGSTYMSSAGNPNTLINDLPTEGNVLGMDNQRRMVALFNKLYNPSSTGSMTPLGYASPIQWGSSYNDAPVAES